MVFPILTSTSPNSQVDLLLSFCQQLKFSSVVLVGHDDGELLPLMAAAKILKSLSSTQRGDITICSSFAPHFFGTAHTPAIAVPGDGKLPCLAQCFQAHLQNDGTLQGTPTLEHTVNPSLQTFSKELAIRFKVEMARAKRTIRRTPPQYLFFNKRITNVRVRSI
ncbi:hypothetical protein SELMODRAFT_423297 [Selaginella moellendorffii]|uniref:Uncharacterized protein n=1 Tax=Selaginella moellendorffii TaxID=88036 RepID=D8SL78_SELML|nr:hypothetical protein SELMODRAFT_423297 [Selaginella moellendorffii]